jgi:hypothetical protein
MVQDNISWHTGFWYMHILGYTDISYDVLQCNLLEKTKL